MALDLTLAGKVTMDAKQARGELQGVTKDAQATKKAVDDIGKEAKGTDSELSALRAELAAVRKDMQALTSDNARAIQQMDLLQSEVDQLNTKLKGVNGAGKGAAGSMGNLVAQFNDIGVMMAAGQNSVQLAFQQGTQITQVIGPMGAAGAVRALGGAFVSMLSPLNLVTIGGIAAGAAMVKWMMSAKEEGRDLDDVLGEIEDSIDALHSAASNLDVDNFDELKEKYGSITTSLIEMLEAQRAMAQLRAWDDLIEAQDALAASAEDVIGALGRLDQKGRTLRNAYAELERTFGLTREEADALRDAVDAAANAGSPQEQAEAYKRMRQLISDAVKSSGKLTDEQEDLLNNLLSAEDAARRFAAVDMVTGVSAAANEASRMASEVIKAVEATQALKSQAGVDLETAQIRLQYAADPVELARQLGTSKMRREQEPLRQDASPLDLAGLEAEARAYGDIAAQVAQLDQERITSLKSSRSAGRASKSETDALVKLIEREQEQIALLRETDPVQKEMIRNRDALAGATEAERAAIEDLIRTRLDEQDALDELQGKRELFTDTTYDAMDGLVLKGDSLADVFENVAASIAKAVLQAALLGEGSLANLFGGAGSGGLLGALAEVFVPAKADGGPIEHEGLLSGPGGGRSDSILMYGSSGEFIMNAKATKRHRHTLELMNAGGIPRFANGGAIGGGNGGGANVVQLQPVLINNTSTPMQMEVEETTDSRGQRQQKYVLSDAVATGMSGGAAKRQMKTLYGARLKGIGRG